MPQENVATLRALADAFSRLDVGAAIQGCTEDVELRPAVEGIGVDAFYQGRDGLMVFWEQISEAWEEVTVELRETIEAPRERVAPVERWRVRGRDDLELDLELIDVYTFRDGLIARIDGFRNRAEALAAVGLSE
jgi:ketosteroid isomerase-like protein